MKKNHKLVIVSVTAALSSLAFTGVSAKGCNGVVNQLEWGCAAWDNNNGPNFPHYQKPGASERAPAVVAPSAALVPNAAVLAPNAGRAGVISRDTAGIVSHDGGGIVSHDGGGLRK